MRCKVVFLMALPMLLAACNSITGTQPANVPTLNAPIKNCLDDFRAVNILQPFTEVQAGTRQLVTWEVMEFCSEWDGNLEVSYDNQKTWQSCGCTHGGCMMCWPVPDDAAGMTAWVRVTVRDNIGEVQDLHSYLIRQPLRHPGGEQRD